MIAGRAHRTNRLLAAALLCLAAAGLAQWQPASLGSFGFATLPDSAAAERLAKPVPVLSSGRTFSTEEAMSLLGYKDSTTWWQAVRRAGIPFVRISSRRAVFRERDLEAWMEARTVGAVRPAASTTGGAS